MGGKGDNSESRDPYTGRGYSAKEMPKDAPVGWDYNPLTQPGMNPAFGMSPGALLMLPKTAFTPAATNFDDYELNDMVDLVDAASPQDLDDVAEALWDAARAIKSAETELRTYCTEAERGWQGETQQAFHDWAKNLQDNTAKLSEYAAAVGTHLKGAGIGLAMVHGSMPKRESEGEKHAKKAGGSHKGDGKKDEAHDAAVIQMNRLSSYYQVALQNIQAAEKNRPVFSALPEVGVPPAPPGFADPSPSGVGATGGSRAASVEGSPTERSGNYSSTGPARPGDAPAVDVHDGGHVVIPPGVADDLVRPGRAVATNIDTTAPPVTTPVDGGSPPHSPPVASQPNLPNGPGPMTVPPPATGRMGPGGQGPGRSFVPPLRAPAPPTQTGPGGSANRPGRPGPVTGASGTNGRTGGTDAANGLRRPGMMGVPPGAVGSGAAPNGRSGNAGSGRAMPRGGIVGGTPNQGDNARSTAPRLPRGTVIDNQGTTQGRRPMGMVPPVGAAGAGTKGETRDTSSRRVASSPGGVVGEPRSGDDTRVRGLTPGSAGLVVGGHASSAKPDAEESPSRRHAEGGEPSPQVERQRGVPPVVE